MPSLVYDVKDVRTIRELLTNSVELYPDRVAFLFKDKESNVRTKTYKEVYNDVIGLATYLKQRAQKQKSPSGHNC